MKLSQQSLSIIESAIQKAVAKYVCSCEQTVVTDILESVEPSLRNILCRMKDAGDFDKVTILKPYSFVLVDEEKETVAELLLIDDDTILVNDELLKGLDKELDDFLKELLEK